MCEAAGSHAGDPHASLQRSSSTDLAATTVAPPEPGFTRIVIPAYFPKLNLGEGK
jgi:hypothetical protein